ncbi:hypothetical protein SKAU_G00120790 [Synaphobranchus kaupii]|uniref:Platelet-derived growth factor subunit B n=1 Tax=Synaphobranchus kaupii TaxID=118154 RepID=A0A9Q1FPA7_SYNKA|nr:hypothetical protein SKAU_G00120790 [Synaphobranchus kaupii]
MSSWVLLLAALAACVRLASTEGDPLPPALVELVRSSPISSIQDLQLLLAPDSVDEDPDSQTSRRRHANTSKRVPRSLAAEQAQQAVCKVRTEVLEVTRDMLDRRNANFMLWPPCVEVQRCSGCCNSRAIQCVPMVTRTRYLQVLKIQYVNRKSHYEKAVISVQDHVECRCQISAPPPAPRTTAKKPQHALQPQRPAPKTLPLKTLSKEELHKQDELKQNQNLRPDYRDSQHALQPEHTDYKRVPEQPSTTRTPATQTQTSRSPVPERRKQTEQTPLQGGGQGKAPQPTQETHGVRRDEGERKPPHRSGDGSTVWPHAEQQPHPHTHPHRQSPNLTAQERPAVESRTHTHPHPHRQSPNLTAQERPAVESRTHTHPHPHRQSPNLTAQERPAVESRTHTHPHPHRQSPNLTAQERPAVESRTHTHHTQAGSPLQQGSVAHNQDHNHNHSQDHNHNHNQDHNPNQDHSHSRNQSQDHNHNHSQDHNQDHSHSQSQNHSHDHNHNPNQSEQTQHAIEQQKDSERSETEGGRLLQLNLQEKQELLLLQRKLEQEKEELQRHSHHHHEQQHHLHHQVPVHTTTQKPVTSALITARPPPPTKRAPVRYDPFRRRLRKNRRRMSKAAMRAMLM